MYLIYGLPESKDVLEIEAFMKEKNIAYQIVNVYKGWEQIDLTVEPFYEILLFTKFDGVKYIGSLWHLKDLLS